MNKKVFILLLGLLCCTLVGAQEAKKSELQQRAESADEGGNIASARFYFIRSFEDYADKGQMAQSVACGVKGATLYHKENYWKEAFELLRRIDQTIEAKESAPSAKAGLHYQVTKERLQMYTKLRKPESAKDQLNIMESQVSASSNEDLKNDLLYNKAVYYYSFGQNAQGNAIFKEMADKLTAKKEYDKVDEVYQTLIANGRKSGSANLVAQSYSSYILWKDSVDALKRADEIGALKQQIADNEAEIADKDSSLSTRRWVIVGLSVLVVGLAAVLAVGAVILLRFIMLTRKQKKTIQMANENNALKAKFISNISAQLEPTLQKLDSRMPEVKALLDFSSHVQTLSALESTAGEEVEKEDTQMPPFCEGLMEQIRNKVKKDVTLSVNAPKMSAKINKEYVSHIVQHLLQNAAEYTPEGGKISLDFMKRSAHKFQFQVSNTGSDIPEEKRDDVFKPFLEVKDLTVGDGLGLPICKQMAVNMGGDLNIDGTFTKGTRFVLDLYA